jgi:chromosome segregation ATPase
MHHNGYSSADNLGDAEKIFNLQLAISKLQEEVTLYRNGVDVPQLLELIKEKDNEIDSMKDIIAHVEDKNLQLHEQIKERDIEIDEMRDTISSLEDKTFQLQEQIKEKEDKTFQLLESRAQMISKHEELLESIHQSRLEKETAVNKVIVLEETLIRKENDSQLLEKAMRQLEEKCREKDHTISSLKTTIETIDKNNTELQSRCAHLVQEKTALTKLTEKERSDKSKQISEYRAQIDKSIMFNNQIKEKLDQEHSKGLDLARKLKDKEKELQSTTNAMMTQTREIEGYKRTIENLKQEYASLRRHAHSHSQSNDKHKEVSILNTRLCWG